MTKAWLIRPMPHNINRIREFRDYNIIAIGWPQIFSLSGKNKQEIKSELEHSPLNYSANELGIATSTVNNFVNGMRIGDICVVPDGNNIYFCTITSDYFYDQTSKSEGYPHKRSVKWIKGPVRRDDLFDELRQSLRAPRTLADLSHHLDKIRDFISDEDEEDTTISNDDYAVFEYPIRLDTMARVRIPKNITESEAARLSEFIKTLYFDE